MLDEPSTQPIEPAPFAADRIGGSGETGDEPCAQSIEPPPFAADLQALVQRAQSGDAAALPQLRQLLDDHPEIWQRVGDLSALVERAWVGLFAANHPLGLEAMRRSTARMKTELLGERPTPLERLMADQVVATFLEVKFLEYLSAQPGTSEDQAKLRLKRLESATKRYLNSVKMLTSLRALLPTGLTPPQSIRLFDPDCHAV